MIDPKMVGAAEKKIEDENVRFRSFLKNNVDSDELDGHFAAFHEELFASFDCRSCCNCCRSSDTVLTENDIKRIAAFLGVSQEQWIKDCGISKDEDGDLIISAPCKLLLANGECSVEKVKPQTCREFPHTNKPNRMASLLGILAAASVCPIVFEILERLKKVYGFR